jgi:hypothetical protein
MSIGAAALKSTANTAALTGGLPFFPSIGFGDAGPSNATGSASSGGSPISGAPVVIGRGSGSARSDVSSGSTASSTASPRQTFEGRRSPNPQDPQYFGGVLGGVYGAGLPQPGSVGAPVFAGSATANIPDVALYAALGLAAFFIGRKFL